MGISPVQKLRDCPLTWIAFGLGLVIFVLIRVMPGSDWSAPRTEQSLLDEAYSLHLKADPMSYGIVEDSPQTYGSHVLTQYLCGLTARVTGNVQTAGYWLSLVGIVSALGGMYAFSRRIFPLREYAMISVVALAGLGTLHYSWSADPSTSMGLALVLWGMAFFLSAVERANPRRVFLSAICFGLAGYIRFELSFIWIPLAFYLFAQGLYDSPARKRGLPLPGMALTGLLIIALLLWPMVNRNVMISGTPVLPGFDADLILGAPVTMSGGATPSFFGRLMEGLSILMFDNQGAGIFIGLLWPIGIVLSTMTHRERTLPFFWLPFILLLMGLLTGMSFLTGLESFEEALHIITPLLLPFSILPPVFVVFHWIQRTDPPGSTVRMLWLVTGLGILLLAQVPHMLSQSIFNAGKKVEVRQELVEAFSRRPNPDLDAVVLSDMPGVLAAAGKQHVLGLAGETNWRILTTKYSDGTFQVDQLVEYMREKEVELLHLSDVENPLADAIVMEEGAPGLKPLEGFSPPHRVFQVEWP